MNRLVRCADRVVLAVLMALVAVLGTKAGAAAVPQLGAEHTSPASSPADPAGEGPQDTSETEQPPPGRAEQRRAPACGRDAAVTTDAAPDAYPHAPAAAGAPPPAPPVMRFVVLRC
ncbi:hypothetical protein ACWGI8_34835 [Streptomyces sp. NPDC054841]